MEDNLIDVLMKENFSLSVPVLSLDSAKHNGSGKSLPKAPTGDQHLKTRNIKVLL